MVRVDEYLIPIVVNRFAKVVNFHVAFGRSKLKVGPQRIGDNYFVRILGNIGKDVIAEDIFKTDVGVNCLVDILFDFDGLFVFSIRSKPIGPVALHEGGSLSRITIIAPLVCRVAIGSSVCCDRLFKKHIYTYIFFNLICKEAFRNLCASTLIQVLHGVRI